MDIPAPEPQDPPVGLYTVERYFRLVDEGVLEPNDRVELLEGVAVALAPHAIVRCGQHLDLAAFPGTSVAVDDLLLVLRAD